MFLIFVLGFSFEFSTDSVIGNSKRSFMYLPTHENIRCSGLNIINTTNLKVISSITNDVCTGTSDGGFIKDYVLGSYKNYYIQHENQVSPTASYSTDDLDSDTLFTMDVKIDENIYKSYKYIPLLIDTNCNELFGLNNYIGVNVKTADGRFCIGYKFCINKIILIILYF